MTASDGVLTLTWPWLLAFTVFSAAPVLRIGDVQLLEMAQVLAACGAAAWFVRGGFRARLPVPWRQYGGWYAVLLLLCAAGSLAALRLDFYPPAETPALKQPAVLWLARLVELSLAVYAMLAAASAMRRDSRLLRWALDVYCGLAAFTAAASILSWILLEGGDIATPMVYGFDSRVRGLFNEGGPYGIFLVSAGLAEILRTHVFPPVYRFRTAAILILLAAALLLSGSKAGLLAGVLLSGMAGIRSASPRRRAVLLLAGVATLAATAALFEKQFLTYWLLYQHMEEAAAYHPGDRNFVMGRVTGAFIVPRMVEAHPWSGIGLGNYSLMRNNPEYLQGLPPVEEWDLPGMGLLGDAAELGVPLTLLLWVVLVRPFWKAAKWGRPMAVMAAAAFQPVAVLLGVNLNFFYPWLMTAFALAAEPPL